MTADAAVIATTAAWVATAIALALWIWSWLGEKNPIQKLRYRDCGVVLMFSSILVRVVAQEGPMRVFDWAMVVFAPLFIGAALWRLARTGAMSDR